jgi:hypothetical protein
MKIFASLHRGIRAMLAPEVRLPSINIRPPAAPVMPVTSAAPVATYGEIRRGNPRDLEAVIAQVGSMTLRELSAARQAIAAKPAATVPRLGSRTVSRRAASPAASTVDENFEATDKEGVPIAKPAPADPFADAIKTLEDCLQRLREMHPDVSDADADADEEQARTALRAGRKLEARRHFDAAIDKLTARIVAHQKHSALRAEPSSRSRANRLTASGFSGMPSVAALNSALGRGGALSIVDRASLALAPVAGRIPKPPAISTPAAPSGSRERIIAIKAQMETLDKEFRRTAIYSPEAQARHATLTRDLKAEMSKFRSVR